MLPKKEGTKINFIEPGAKHEMVVGRSNVLRQRVPTGNVWTRSEKKLEQKARQGIDTDV